VQLLFGVADPEDPICEVVAELLEEFKHANARLVICPENVCANPKFSTLAQLAPLAEHHIVVVSDADVLISFDFLPNAIQPLRDPDVGLVSAFYRLANPSTLAMYCEAVAVNSDFWSQVLQARMLKPMDFALGAVMITRREILEAIGGFRALGDYLADDYQLGQKINGLGKRVELTPVVVECWDVKAGWHDVWSHELRWARTIRVSRPFSFFASILGNVTFWALLWVLTSWPNPVGVLCILVGRMLIAGTLAQRLISDSGNPFSPQKVGMVAPIKDLFGVGIWLFAFLGNKVTWRNITYRVMRDGRLVPAN
jgi:ceramide glucosyltransferase